MDLFTLVEPGVVIRLVTSLAVVAIVLGARALATRAIRRNVSNPELRRRWSTSVRNSLFLLLSLGLISIWAQTIQTFVLSTVAVAVAIVIATKELLVCVLASLVRGISDAYSVGDRVVIGAHRGDVVDHNLLTTTLLEVDGEAPTAAHTGRLVVVPNSAILADPIVNESQAGAYVVHRFSVPVRFDGRWHETLRLLETAAQHAAAPHVDAARQRWTTLARSRHVDVTPPDPSVTIQLVDPEQIAFQVRLPCPTGQQGAVQDEVLRRFLEASASVGRADYGEARPQAHLQT